MLPTVRSLALCGAGALLLAPDAGTAQLVAGRVVDEIGAPVAGALVTFTDSSGGKEHSILSRENGAFRLLLPVPGRWGVRVERIGYARFEEPGLMVPPEGLTGLDLRLGGSPIELEDVVVDARRVCSVRPAEAAELALVWDEARKALAGAAWAREQSGLRYRVVRWSRVLDHRGRPVSAEADTSWVTGARAFEPGDARELDERGWMQHYLGGQVYFGPAEETILSPVFQDKHCFSLTERGGLFRRDMIGLRFEPLEGRAKPDIEGVIWIDKETGELDRMEFVYTGLLAGNRTRTPPGGELSFARLSDGTWIVDAWVLRVPARYGAADGGMREARGEILSVEQLVPPPR